MKRTKDANFRLIFSFFAAVLLTGAGTLSVQAQVSLTTLGTPYTQNFNTLPASSSATFTNNATLTGWYSARTGTGTTIVANDGSSNAGNLYSYGTGTSTDRALGSLGSGNAAIGNLFWGVRLVNNTGSTITRLNVSYTGEQWRNSAAAAQTISFSYLIGTPSVTGSLAEFQTAGTAISNLDFTSPITGGVAGALDGNAAANRTAITFSITGLSIPDGTEIMLRWSDPDHTGSDHGLAIDDVSVTPDITTAAGAEISGRVLTAGGMPIARATVTLSGGQFTQPIVSTTGAFGYYRFPDLPVGQTYVVTVSAGKQTFSNPSQVLNFNANVTGADFVADP